MFDRKSKAPAEPTLLDRVVKSGSQRVAILGLHAQAGTRTVLASLVRELSARSSPLAYALAFFQFDDDAMYQQCKAIEPPVGRYHHIALKVARATFDEILQRADAARIEHRELDHGYCLSTYMMSPDGLRVEFTVDPDDVDRIDAMRRADAHAELKRWLRGDHRTNNDDRPDKDAAAM